VTPLYTAKQNGNFLTQWSITPVFGATLADTSRRKISVEVQSKASEENDRLQKCRIPKKAIIESKAISTLMMAFHAKSKREDSSGSSAREFG
jgi:hypothetical protein